VITMARQRPIKLHIKDGKDTTFRLIGPKGRVLNTLDWDGERLELMDAFDVEDVQEEQLEVANEETIQARNKIGETEIEAVARVEEDNPDKEVEFEDPDTPPSAAPAKEGDENLANILGDEPPTSPVDAPESDESHSSEIGEKEGVDDVSGESEVEIKDEELADLLTDDSLGIPDIEESDEVPEDKDSKTEAVEETKKPE